jgi:hypothetical protein
MTDQPNDERLRRWRLLLGGEADNALCQSPGLKQGEIGAGGVQLSDRDQAMDQALAMLYGDNPERGAGNFAPSAPKVARWLGDIRTYFPSSVVRVMQKDALERLNLTQMLLEPELLETVEPDVHLVATLLTLNRVMPETTRETARQVVRRLVEELERRLKRRTVQAITGSLNRADRSNRRPRHHEIDWQRTIRANLKHYQPEYRTIIPERRLGYGRKQSSLRDIILCVDQSGSMATSVVYSSIFGAVMASVRALSVRMVVYDTSVVDLTDDLQDPVDLLFGAQLGGDNDTPRALAYCQSRIRRPADTILVLVSDLYEGGRSEDMIKRMRSIVASGVQVITLLALNDSGAPTYDARNAEIFANMGIPTFACTPDLFPDLMAAAIARRDLKQWVAANAGQ